MCGIAGVIRFGGGTVEAPALERACAAIFHRGPDHTGVWVAPDRGAGLAAVRLSVLDPTPAAHQPMHDPSGRYHLVYNGEIYNFRELRRELQAAGDAFVTDGDTEVVLYACARWGTDALRRLNGMWALAFYDSERRGGFLARDRFGIKPLLYAVHEGDLCFASEMRGLTPLGSWDRTIDSHALAQHLTFGYISAPGTIYSGARRLGPGEFLRFSEKGPQSPEQHYTLPAPMPGAATPDYAEACARVRRDLLSSVDLQKVSDVLIGAFLSGGLDSSIVVAHLAAVLGRPVKTFCVGHAEHKAYDETPYARLVARHFGTDHHELRLTRGDVLAAVPHVLDHLGEPVGDSSIIPTWLVSQFAAQHVTVALSGDGGDELFGGYWRYLAHDALRAYERLPRLLRAGVIEPIARRMSTSKSSALGNRVRQFRKLLRGAGRGVFERHVAWSRILAPEADDLLTDGNANECVAATLAAAGVQSSDFASADPLTRVMAFDIRHSLPSDMLHKVDLASMAHSLEVRVPFLDPHVVAGAMALPGDFKINRGLKKKILTDAYRGRLPDDVLDRGKVGFEVPIGEFLRTDLREMFQDVVSRPAVEAIGGIRYDGVQRLFREHQDRRGEHADVLFALLSLCWWHKR